MIASDGTRAPRTLGVEEEFLLVDSGTGQPVAVVEAVLAAASAAAPRPDRTDGPPPLHLESEAKQEQVEAISPPSTTLDELSRAIAAGRRMADDAARTVGARAAALATSVLPFISHVAPNPRYDRMREQFGLMMREQLTCGFHVHVAIASEEEGVAVLDRIRPWLPVLLALSSNSPFWRGQNTGYASYRYQAWTRWPSSGPYDVFGSAGAYRRTVESMIASGVLLDRGMVYFDARLCDHYPTIEVRVADVCMDPEHAVAIAGLVRALVDTAAQEWRNGVAPDPVQTAVLRLAMWSASRFGVGATLVNPLLGEQWEARVAVEALLAHVEPALAASGDLARVVGAVESILGDGTGSVRQLLILERTGRPRDVVADAVEFTNQDCASPSEPAPA